MRNFSVKAVCRTAALIGALMVGAAPVLGVPLVANGSFENTTATTTSTWWCPSLCTVANWSTLDYGQLIVLPSWYTNGYLVQVPLVGVAGALPQSSPDGGNFIFSDSDYHNSAITQTITGLQPGRDYMVSFYQSLIQDTELFVTIPGPVSGEWQVTFGTTTLNSAFMTGDGSTLSFYNWKPQSMKFKATSPTQVLSFLAVGTGDPPLAGLDGVKVVPEPDSGILLLMGLLGFGAVYRFTHWQRIGRQG